MAIVNPNTSGQGFDSDHVNNPHHATLTEFGCVYSHSTRIGGETGYIHHTYRMPIPDWCVGVSMRPGTVAEAGKLGSGRKTPLFGSQLRKYLTRKLRKIA